MLFSPDLKQQIRHRSCLVTVLILLAFFCPNSGLASYNDEHGFLIAADLLNRGMYLESVGMYQEIAENASDPNRRAQALLFIGTTYSLYLEQYDSAISIYQQVLTKYPQSPSAGDALFNIGMVDYEQGHFDKAYQTFEKYLQSYPQGMRSQSAAVWADSAKTMSLEQKKTPPPPTVPAPPKKLIVPDTMIRVLIVSSNKNVSIRGVSPLQIIDPYSKKELYVGNGTLTIYHKNNKLLLNNKQIGLSKCRLTSNSPIIGIGKRKYRGNFTISTENSIISVINHINLEQYLYGVVPKEMPYKWNKQALMAQAVAARTYALYIKSKSSDKNYDVEATTASQVYGGYDAEKPETNAAVDATNGRVMTYDNRLIVAYFHANSGGYTEDPSNVWKAELPYLKSVPDKYSLHIPNGEWQYFLSYDKATQKLKQSGLKLGDIRQIRADGKSKSGRTLKVTLNADLGASTLPANNFRIKIGGTKLKSTLFNIYPETKGVLFKGKGYGHGVGMSQWGADKMADSGFAYQNILKYYYHDIRIMTIDG